MATMKRILLLSNLLVLIIADMESERAAPPGHMLPIGSHRPMEGHIKRLSEIPDPITFYEEYVLPKQPVVMEGALRDTFPINNWTDEYFRDVIGNEEVTVELMKKEVRKGPGTAMKMKKFLKQYNDKLMYVVDALPAQLREEMLLPGCIACGGIMDNVAVVYMWFSSGGTKSVLHTDSLENMHCVVDGRKEFVMIPPQYTEVIGPEWMYQGYYNMDVEKVNMTQYPKMADVPWYRAIINKGDCMYLPFHWIHHVYSEGRNLGVNMWWVPFRTFQRDECTKMKEYPSLVSLKGLKIKEFLQTKLLFYNSAKEDGYIYLNDVKEKMSVEETSSFLTDEHWDQMVHLLEPDSDGVRLKVSSVLGASDEALLEMMELLNSVEEKALNARFEEEGIPLFEDESFDMMSSEEDNSEDDIIQGKEAESSNSKDRETIKEKFAKQDSGHIEL